MADCKKCDRCGTFYEYYGVEDDSNRLYNGMANSMCFCFETSVAGNVYEKQKIDLCSNCFRDLVHFIKQEVVLVEKYIKPKEKE